MRFARWTIVFVALAVACAHDIPNDVVTQSFLKPSGTKLNLLMRVPLTALRDISWPERPPGYLDLDRVDSFLPDAATLWLSDFIDLYEGDRHLAKPRVVATRISLPSDRSFETYDAAAAHLTGPKLSPDTNIVWNQAMLDVWFEYPIASEASRFSIHPGLARLGLRVTSALRFLPVGQSPSPGVVGQAPSPGVVGQAPSPAPDAPVRLPIVRAFAFIGDPGLIRLDPHWYQAALQFVKLGFEHILSGTDHLLFLFCLVIPFRQLRALIPIVTSFTVAHSITLIASAYNLAPTALWFPPLVEALIAASIVYMALENIVGTTSVHRRWIITFGFGLVHGFGFSFALRETLQFAGSHLLASLLSFNLGVELGQLFVLALMIPLLDLLFRYVVKERMGTIILSALVAHTGWHWMIDRGERVAQFRFEWPEFTAAQWANGLGWLFVLVLAAALVWFGNLLWKRIGLRGVHGNAESREIVG